MQSNSSVPRQKTTVAYLLALLCLNLPTAIWIQWQHLSLFSPQLLKYYPFSYWAEAVCIGVLVLVSLSLATTSLVLSLLKFPQTHRYLVYDALAHAPMLLLWYSPQFSCYLFYVMVFKGLAVAASKPVSRSPNIPIGEHAIAVSLIVLIQLAFNQFISPLAWDNPLAGILRNESAYQSMLQTSYGAYFTRAHRFSFDGFQRGLWGSMPYSLTGASVLVGFLTAALNIPTLDVESYQRMLLIIFFVLSILGSYFFYLLLYRAFKLSYQTAALGGGLYLLANPAYGNNQVQYFPLFLMSYLLLPIALWSMHLAFLHKRPLFAALSGAILSLGYYVIQSHPDGILHGLAMWALFSLFLGQIHRSSLGSTLYFILIGSFCWALGLMAHLLPILEGIFKKELRIFGHQEAFHFVWGLKGSWNFMFLAELRNFGGLIPFFLIGIWGLIRKNIMFSKERKTTLLFWGGLLFFILLIFAPGEQGPFSWLLHRFHIGGIVFRETSRFMMYYNLTLLILLLFGLDLYFENSGSIPRLAKWFSCIVIISSVSLYYRRYAILSYLLPWTVVTAFLIFLLLRIKKTSAWSSLALGISLAITLTHESNMGWTSAKLDENHRNCKPYISLSAQLIKAKFFPEDLANSETYIRNRLDKYTRDSTRTLAYPLTLASFFSSEMAREVDSYYRKEFFCRFPFQSHHKLPLRRYGIDHNAIILFEKIDDPYQWFLNASSENLGAAEGLLALNFDTDPDLTFMMPYPNIASVYATPSSFLYLQGLQFTPLNYAHPLNNPIRKIRNIAGVDLTVLDQSMKNEISDDLDLQEISHDDTAESYPHLAVLNDLRSYGIAYFATRIHPIPPTAGALEYFLPPFDQNRTTDREQYIAKTNSMQNLLLQLEEKYEIYLEGSNKSELETGGSGGKVEVLRVSGNKAAFSTVCTKEPCQFVFNMAALSGWRLFSDSTRLPVDRANFAFLSALIPPGAHTVWLEYRPLGKLCGQYLTLLVYFVVLACCFTRLTGEALLIKG